MSDTPRQPTPEECSANVEIFRTDYDVGYACWYPQMGGYGGRAVAVFTIGWTERPGGSRSGGCVDVYVWHDGEFPFNEDYGRVPALVHHCAPEQFITFGEWMEQTNNGLMDDRP